VEGLAMPSSSSLIKDPSSDSREVTPAFALSEFPFAHPGEPGALPNSAKNPDFQQSGHVGNKSPQDGSPLPFHPKPVSRSTVIRYDRAKECIAGWTAPVFNRKTPRMESTLSNQNSVEFRDATSEARENAEEIVAAAVAEAEKIINDARTEAENIRRQAFSDGMNTAKAETASTMRQVGKILHDTQLWQEQMMNQSTPKIIEMIVAFGRKLFGNGFEIPAEQLDQVVSKAINEASRLGNLRIYLHPEDAKKLVNLWQESEITVNGQLIQIVSSQNITRGGCFVDGEFGIVDGRVEEQVDLIADTLKPSNQQPEISEE
jgi:flagellar assembly protein FliH